MYHLGLCHLSDTKALSSSSFSIKSSLFINIENMFVGILNII